MKTKYDCIVIGGGPAALQAGLFLTRANVSTLIIGEPQESDLASGEKIGNYFGIVGEPPGKALLSNGVLGVKKYGGEILEDEVVDMAKKNKEITVDTANQKSFKTEAVIIATGKAYEKAGIQNEDKFFGKGVHTCVACDGIFYKEKVVGIVGFGSHAAQEAIELTDFSKDVTIYTQGAEPAWSDGLGKLLKNKKIKIKKNTIIKLNGKENVTGVTLEDDSIDKLAGIFVALGSASSVTFANKVGLIQKDSFLVIDRDGKTNVDGIWAAGAATGGNAQIAKSVGEGANAAISVIEKIKGLSDYKDQT